jgi:hypothetical protein
MCALGDYAEVDCAAVLRPCDLQRFGSVARTRSKALIRRPRGHPRAAPKGRSRRAEPVPELRTTHSHRRSRARADCWNPKTLDAEPVIRRQSPRTEPLGLLDWLDDVPEIVLVLALIAIGAGLVLITLSWFL